jgi:hypothetical protein
VPREESFVTRAAFWRAWPLWAVTMTITAIAIGYDALHPLPAMLADQSGNSLDMVAGLTFIVAFATVGAVLAWQRPGNPSADCCPRAAWPTPWAASVRC